MKTSIVIHPHSHLSASYVQTAIAHTFSHSCSYNTYGNGIHLGTFAQEEAEMHALSLLQSWIPTHLTTLPMPGKKVKNFNVPPASSAVVKIPLHRSKLNLLLEERLPATLHFERLIACLPVTDSEIFITHLLEHCCTSRTSWLGWLDRSLKEDAFILPHNQVWPFLQVLQGLQLTILLQSRLHKNSSQNILPLLVALQHQVITYLR
jgi:hypothetical protein